MKIRVDSGLISLHPLLQMDQVRRTPDGDVSVPVRAVVMVVVVCL